MRGQTVLSNSFKICIYLCNYLNFYIMKLLKHTEKCNDIMNLLAQTDFIFLGSKITVDGDCSHEIERCLLFESKVMTNLDSIVKSRTLFC